MLEKQGKAAGLLPILLLSTLACTVSFGGNGKAAATETMPESFYLQQTVQAQFTQMAGSSSGSAPATVQPTLEIIPTAEPPKPCSIVYFSDINEEEDLYHLYLLDSPSGSPRRLLPDNNTEDYHASWSPDGTRVAFVLKRDGNDELFVSDADGGNQLRLTDNSFDDYWPAWSPLGGQIAFVAKQNDISRIFVINPNGGGLRQVSAENDWDDTHPTWSPDGGRLGFSSNRDGDWDIYVMNTDGSAVQQLTNAAGTDWDPNWAPNGERLAFASKRVNDSEIYIINSDGSGEKQLTDAPGNDWLPVWSPDGRLLTFTSGRLQNEDIFVMGEDGADERLLIATTASDRMAIFSPECTSQDLTGMADAAAAAAQAPAAPAEVPTAEAQALEPSGLIQKVSWNRNTFFCVKSDGPATITFNAVMSDVDRGLAIFWRLYEKASGKMTDWQNVSMTRAGGDERTFTFNADAFGANNNFFYPPLFGESWFQVQFISGDGKSRTEIYRGDITFFPCAQ